MTSISKKTPCSTFTKRNSQEEVSFVDYYRQVRLIELNRNVRNGFAYRSLSTCRNTEERSDIFHNHFWFPERVRVRLEAGQMKAFYWFQSCVEWLDFPISNEPICGLYICEMFVYAFPAKLESLDFRRLKIAMRPYTAMDPPQRIRRLMNLNVRLRGAADSMQTLTEWQLNLDTSLVTVPGRELPAQAIYFADGEL